MRRTFKFFISTLIFIALAAGGVPARADEGDGGTDGGNNENNLWENPYSAMLNEMLTERDALIRQLQAQLGSQPPNDIIYEPMLSLQRPATVTGYGGRTSREDIIIRNIGSDAAVNVLVHADAGVNAPFTARFIEETNLIPKISAGASQTLKLEIKTDRDAPTGTYAVSLTYLYFNAEREPKKDTGTIYVRIENDDAILNVIMYNFESDKRNVAAGEAFELKAVIENVSRIDAADVSVTIGGLEVSGIYLADSVGNTYFRELGAGAAETASYRFAADEKIKSGSYPIVFSIKYRDGAGNNYDNSYTYYVNVAGAGADKPEDETKFIRVEAGEIAGPIKTYGVNEDFTITVPIMSTGEDAAKYIRVEASAGTDGALVPRSADKRIINNLAPGEQTELSFTFAATSKAKSQNYTIGIAVTYASGKAGADGATEGFTQYVGVNIDSPEPDDVDTDKRRSEPKIIISRYSSEPTIVKAGQEFDLSLTFMNTHAAYGMKNIKAFLTTTETTESKGNVFTPVNASNTFYVDHIAPKGEVELGLRMYTVPDASPKNYIITVNFEYEDDDNNTYKAAELIGINVKQVTKFEMGDLNISQGSMVGRPVSVYFDFYNTGKVTLSNLMIKIEGNFDTMNSSSYYSNFNPGYSDYYEGSFMPLEAGLQDGRIVITYEDDSGEKIEETHDFTVNVEEEFVPDFSDMPGSDFYPDFAPPEPETVLHKILFYLTKPWAVGAIAAAIFIAAFIVTFKVRRSIAQRKSLEADE